MATYLYFFIFLENIIASGCFDDIKYTALLLKCDLLKYKSKNEKIFPVSSSSTYSKMKRKHLSNKKGSICH